VLAWLRCEAGNGGRSSASPRTFEDGGLSGATGKPGGQQLGLAEAASPCPRSSRREM